MVESPANQHHGVTRGTLIRWYPGAARWPYVFPALTALLFVGHAVEDAGLGAAAVLLGVVALCIVQAVWPTIGGWALLFAPLTAYGIVVALSPESGSRGEWVFFMSFGFVPAIALWLGRPWRKKRATNQAGEHRAGA
jgi:hypothetical protein